MSASDLPGLIGELERLAGKATALPWKASDDQPDDVVIWGACVTDPNGDTEDVFVANVGASPIQQVGVAFDIDTHNAALIVAAVNALPKLLAVAKAAQALMASEHETTDDLTAIYAVSAEYYALDVALRALEKP